MISFSACIGAWSSSRKFILLLAFAPTEALVFFAFTSTIGAITVNDVTIGVTPNELYIGIPAAVPSTAPSSWSYTACCPPLHALHTGSPPAPPSAAHPHDLRRPAHRPQ